MKIQAFYLLIILVFLIIFNIYISETIEEKVEKVKHKISNILREIHIYNKLYQNKDFIDNRINYIDTENIKHINNINQLQEILDILKSKKKPIIIKDTNLKILNLIIYNENEEYERQMKVELENYLKQFENNVLFYFIAYRETQKDYIIVENNCIYIKGKEGFVPQVLDKTIIALEYCIKYLNINFDFFVRSNISSVINFNLFPISKLGFTNVYSGSNKQTLDWLDPNFGINSENIHKLKGTVYAQGTSIILSKNVCDYLLYNKNNLDRSIIDDVSIGILLSKKFNFIDFKQPKKHIINDIDKDAFVIRNKSENRYDDISRINKINNISPI